MKIIITGVAGFIGSVLAQKMLHQGMEVIGIDNFDPYYDPQLKMTRVQHLSLWGGFQFHELDLSVDLLPTKIEADLCVHLAGKPGVLPSVIAPASYVQANILATSRLLEAMKSWNITKIIFGSSSSVYDDGSRGLFNEEGTPVRPRSPYGWTKKVCEEMLDYSHQRDNLQAIKLRFFSVYGPHMRPDLAIYKFTEAIDRGIPISIFGDGQAQRDFTFVDDIVDGIEGSIQYIQESSDLNEVFNLGKGSPVRVIELIRVIEQSLGKSSELAYSSTHLEEMRFTGADITKAKERLNFHPNVDISSGVHRFVDWYKQTKKAT